MTSPKILNNCRVCEAKNFKTVLKLKDTPLEDQFLKEKKTQNTFPLEVAMCQDCSYVFLTHTISADISYESYIYESAITVGLTKHFQDYANEITNTYDIKKNSLIIDLGSNDGSMLNAFKEKKMKTLGVEPAKEISKIANKKGLTTINDFFSSKVADEIISNYGHANVITANYMFANIDDIKDFIIGVKKIMREDGVFIIQTGYHPLQFEKNMFDYIYHEHFSYFTIHSLEVLFKKFDLEIIDAKIFNHKGSSLRVTIKKKNDKNKKSKEVQNLIKIELEKNYNSNNIFDHLITNIKKEKNKLISELKQIKKEGNKIVGLGASHSTTTLFYHYELREYIDVLIDDNPKKHKTYSPGFQIPVYDNSYLIRENIKYIVILAWQHQETILKKYQNFVKQGGIIIIPLPLFRVICP